MSRLAEMEALVAVVRNGSITAGAAQLDTAKSAVSRRIRDLEARLGVQLLTRTTRRLSLTEAGERYVERAEAVLAAVEQADADAASAQGALRGRLRAAVPLSFGLRHLGPLVQSFHEQHPEVSLDLDFSDRRVDLVQDGFDVALRIADLKDSSLIARRLTVIRHAVAASPRYLEKFGMPETPDDLSRHACMDYSGSAESGWRYVAPDGSEGRVRIDGGLRANNGEFMLNLAIAGLGVVMQPTFILADAIRDGRLVPLFTGHRWRELRAWAVYPPTRYLPSRVRAFIDVLAGAFDSDWPYWDSAAGIGSPKTSTTRAVDRR